MESQPFKTDQYDLSQGLSLDASLVPSTGVFMSMDDLIAEAGLSDKAAREVKAGGVGGFDTADVAPTVAPKSATTTSQPVTVTPQALTEISVDMDDFMIEPVDSNEESVEAEEIMYLSDEEVEELRSEGFVFEELDDDAE